MKTKFCFINIWFGRMKCLIIKQLHTAHYILYISKHFNKQHVKQYAVSNDKCFIQWIVTMAAFKMEY